MMGMSRRALSGWIAGLSLGILLCGQVGVHAQAVPPPEKGGIAGTWQGTMHLPNGRSLRTVLKVTKDDKDALHGMFYSIDQSGQGIAMSSISFQSGTLKYAIDARTAAAEGSAEDRATEAAG